MSLNCPVPRLMATIICLVLATGSLAAQDSPSWPDPTGQYAGPASAPPTEGVAEKVGLNSTAINMIWVLICGFLVMFMQAGFAMVETGLCRSQNATHVMAMNFMIYPLACLGFWAYGFAIGWGNWANGPTFGTALGPGGSVLNSGVGLSPVLDDAGQATGQFQYGLLGLKGFFLSGVDDVTVFAVFFFMMVFLDTSATIPTGALAERWAWKNFCIYGLWVSLPYCIYANWVWGGGWLSQCGTNWGLGHGAVDFAGSGVVHAMGGAISLAGLLVMGPRIGKFVNGRPAALPGHNIPMVVTGTFVLAFGWFGFNAGSTLAGTDLRISIVVVNTMLASAAGAAGALVTLNTKGMKPDPSMLCNGMLSGLVAITAGCAFVDAWAAAVIGLIAGIIVVNSVLFLEDSGIDDPVGAVSVHGVNGLWGVIALGLFANGKYGAGWNGVTRDAFVERYGSDGVRGLLYGDATQLAAQALSAGVVVIFGFAMAYVWFELSNRIFPLRVPPENEIKGLDIPEFGARAYPDHVTHPGRPG